MKQIVLALIKDEQDRILLIKEKNDSVWKLPGGKIEKGENYKACLQREISQEELPGVQIVHASKFKTFRLPSVKHEWFYVTICSTLCKGDFSKIAKEIQKVEFVKLDTKKILSDAAQEAFNSLKQEKANEEIDLAA